MRDTCLMPDVILRLIMIRRRYGFSIERLPPTPSPAMPTMHAHKSAVACFAATMFSMLRLMPFFDFRRVCPPTRCLSAATMPRYLPVYYAAEIFSRLIAMLLARPADAMSRDADYLIILLSR